MGMLGNSSFRRILLAGILMLSVPVLLIGEVVAYRKARSVLIETVRQNLTESAIRKGQDIQEAIESLQSHVLALSETYPLQQFGLEDTPNRFLRQIQHQLPPQAQCSQLTDLRSGKIAASTCEDSQTQLLPQSFLPKDVKPLQHEALGPEKNKTRLPKSWYWQKSAVNLDRSAVYISPAQLSGQSPDDHQKGQLIIILSAPVYNSAGELRYALSLQVALNRNQKFETDRPGSLTGYTVVIDQDGTILAHFDRRRLGQNISQYSDVNRLQTLLNVLNQEKVKTGFLYTLESKEWLAGYTTIKVPISDDEDYTWVVLAVTRWDNALARLQGIQRILITLTVVLLTTLFVTTLYVARKLSRPLEQLGRYALQIQHRHTDRLYLRSSSADPNAASPAANTQDGVNLEDASLVPAQERRRPHDLLPQNYKIRELSQLADALDNMVSCLEERATELETAWQEAQVANRLKSEFLANTSHELRTPLNAIIGCIRLVKDGCCDGPEEEQEFLQRADEAAIHLLNVINDLLDIAKIEAGTLSLTLESMNLHQVVQEVIDLQAVALQDKGLDLILSGLDQPLMVRADAAKLKQVLLNILSNAVKFTEQGTITISTRIEEMGYAGTTNHPIVIVAVKDTGIGVDPTQQSKLFRPFVMVDGTTTRKFEGTGLGLAISRNLMRLMGGDVALYSAGIGQGTTVEISLPLSIEPDKTEVSPQPSVASIYAEVTSL